MSMEKRLNELAERMPDEQAARFEQNFSDFGAGAVLSEEARQRILSSVMRKAGFEMKETMVNEKTRKRGRRFIGLVIAAAMVLCMVSAGRFGLIDTLQRHFRGDLSPYTEQLSETIRQVSDDDITMTVHGAVNDGTECLVVISVESHSKKGKKIVGDLGYLTGHYIEDSVKLADKMGDDVSEEEWKEANKKLLAKHGLESDDISLLFSNGERNSDIRAKRDNGEDLDTRKNYLNAMCDGNRDNNKYRFETSAHIDLEYYDYEQPLVITERISGLFIELDISDFIERRKLVSVDGDGFEDVTMSPYSLNVTGTERDLECGRYLRDGGYYGEGEYSEVTIKFKDGSLSKPFAEISVVRGFDDFAGDAEDEEKYREEQYNDVSNIIEQQLVVSVDDDENVDGYYDLDNIESVIIDGIEYRFAEE